MDNSDIQKLVEISRMYHNQGMNQEQIAKVFGISRSAVSMHLAEAKNIGIVQVQIKDPSENNEKLASELAERFRLRKCIVVPSGSHKDDVLLRITTSQAARFASETLFTSHSSVGTAWGSTCREFMRAFPEDTNLCDVNVVPLVGASPLLTQEYQLNESVRMFAEKMRGFPLFIYSPGLVETLEDKRRIMESTFMQSILDRWKNTDYAVLGIGRHRRWEELRGVYQRMGLGAKPEDMRQAHRGSRTMLEEINSYTDLAVGDLCARQFNIHGEFTQSDYNSKLIGIEGDVLKTIKHVMAIAVGSEKVFAIIGALRTNIIHYFITDENTAIQVLDLLNSGALPE
ncbi:MAG: hypothetical protein GXY05_00795 [Clostridiales bacterium]|nr:hypothetical protein [Clostridiales bacterium]